MIEVDLFPEEVDSEEDPRVVEFRRLLEEVAEDYNCNLVAFEINNGSVSFEFDDDSLTAEIIRELEMEYRG